MRSGSDWDNMYTFPGPDPPPRSNDAIRRSSLPFSTTTSTHRKVSSSCSHPTLSFSNIGADRKPRRPTTFGIHSDSDDDTDSADSTYGSYSSDSSSVTDTTSSSDSFLYDESDSEKPAPPSSLRLFSRPHLPSKELTLECRLQRRQPRPPAEARYLEDTVASIRRRVRHHDPYDEWERQMRRDAFVRSGNFSPSLPSASLTDAYTQRTARDELSALQSEWQDQQGRARSQESTQLASAHSRQVAEVEAQLASLDLRRKTEEARLYDAWKERDRKLWERIEGVIKVEEDKVKARLEAERKVREEAERKRREDEERRRLEEEKKREEEERKRKEEEDRKLEEEIEQAMRQADEFEAEQRREQLEEEEQGRNALGLTTADEDWKWARKTLLVRRHFFVVVDLTEIPLSGPESRAHENGQIEPATEIYLERWTAANHT